MLPQAWRQSPEEVQSGVAQFLQDLNTLLGMHTLVQKHDCWLCCLCQDSQDGPGCRSLAALPVALVLAETPKLQAEQHDLKLLMGSFQTCIAAGNAFPFCS